MTPEEKTEIEVPVKEPGEVKFLTRSAFNNPAPLWLKRVLRAVNFTLVGIIGLVHEDAALVLKLAIAVFISGGIEIATGVKPIPEENK